MSTARGGKGADLACLAHVAEELWQRGGHDVERAGTLAHQAWPSWDEMRLPEGSVDIAVQVNGRVRGRLVLARTASADAARMAALDADGVAPHWRAGHSRPVISSTSSWPRHVQRPTWLGRWGSGTERLGSDRVYGRTPG